MYIYFIWKWPFVIGNDRNNYFYLILIELVFLLVRSIRFSSFLSFKCFKSIRDPDVYGTQIYWSCVTRRNFKSDISYFNQMIFRQWDSVLVIIRDFLGPWVLFANHAKFSLVPNSFISYYLCFLIIDILEIKFQGKLIYSYIDTLDTLTHRMCMKVWNDTLSMWIM